MTTSGDTTYDSTGSKIASQALKKLQVLAEDETISTFQLSDALDSLNQMVKTDQMKLGLWRKTEAKLFLVPSQPQYALPGANATDITELTQTTLDAAEASGQTVLSVTSTTGFTIADTIGIMLDNSTIQWTTIVSFVTDDTVTITTALTDSASSGAEVFVYTTEAPRPLKIIGMRRENSGNEIEMFELSHAEYFDLPNKGSEGTPVQYHYDPQLGSGQIYLWPTPTSADDIVNYTYLAELEIFTSTSTADYPQEWQEYLVYGLMLRLASNHGVEMSTAALAIYTNAVAALSQWDAEDTSIRFTA